MIMLSFYYLWSVFLYSSLLLVIFPYSSFLLVIFPYSSLLLVIFPYSSLLLLIFPHNSLLLVIFDELHFPTLPIVLLHPETLHVAVYYYVTIRPALITPADAAHWWVALFSRAQFIVPPNDASVISTRARAGCWLVIEGGRCEGWKDGHSTDLVIV